MNTILKYVIYFVIGVGPIFWVIWEARKESQKVKQQGRKYWKQ